MSAVHSGRQLPLLDTTELDRLVREIDELPAAVPSARNPATQFREFHGWTLDKLDVFEMYLKMYRRVAGSGAFIDAFAGSGRGRLSGDTEGSRDGSALVAAKSGAFASMHLIEKDAGCLRSLRDSVQALSDRQRTAVNILEGDCNVLIPELLGSGQIDPDRPCFALLDQESTQLEWQTIETLSTWKTYEPPPNGKGRPKACKVELWILFNTHQVIYRLWPNDRRRYPESFSPETLDRIMGGRDAWWDLWERHEPASALVRRFADRLFDLGYVYAIPQVIRDPQTRSPQYHMFHATDHPSAVTLMRWARNATTAFRNEQLPGLER